MNQYARALFTVASAFNFAIAAGLVLLRAQLLPMLQLDAVTGTNLALLYIAAALIATYGFAYACVAVDSRKYRVYIPLGVIGKFAVFAVACAAWLSGIVTYRVPALASSDGVFALLFLDYLGRSRPQRS